MYEDFRSKYKDIEDYTSIVHVDEFGFVSKIPTLENKQLLDKNISDEWEKLLKECADDAKKLKHLLKQKKLLQFGLSVPLRRKMWSILLMADRNPLIKVKNTSAMRTIYKNFLFHTFPIELIATRRFEILKARRSEYEYQIHVDIQRTFRTHYLFYNPYRKGQYELFNVLVAFANYHKDVGYCQSMSDIAAVFLMQWPEQIAFTMINNFFKIHNLNKIFDVRFSKLPQLNKIQNEILATLIPDLHTHLTRNIENLNIFFVPWYLTFFTRFPIRITMRVWDYVMVYGFNVLFYFVSAILAIHQPQLNKLTGDDLVIYLNKIHESSIDERLLIDQVSYFIEHLKHKEL